MATKVSIPENETEFSRAAQPRAEISAPPAPAPAASRPPRWLRRYSWLVVAYNVLVILWGAVVRATGSGNGCGDHWPLCGGTVVQHWSTLASVIEFAHRASVGVGVAALAPLVLFTWKRTPRRHLARAFATAAAVLTFNEGLLGALLVVLHHTGSDQSPMRAFWLSLHLANTLLLLAALALTAHFLGRASARMRGGVELRHALPSAIGLLAVLLVGVSGSLAALGDTLYPAHSLAEAFAQDLSPHGSWLLHVRWIHPALSLLTAVWVLFLVASSRRNDSGRLGAAVAGLVGMQIVLGIADVLLLAPTWLQVAHLLGADLLWIALVVLAARVCVRPIGCPGYACALGRKPPQRAAAQPRAGSAASL